MNHDTKEPAMPDENCPLLPPGIAALANVFCGCGSEELRWQVVLNHLRAAKVGESARPLPDPWSGEDYIVSDLLNHEELLGHGVSTHFCWITDEGEAALAFLEQYGANWLETGEFVDADDCHYGNFEFE